ncbi:MAG: hypothetical protein KBD25_00605 [Rickettsiaceae bacterium]|nr:hypothetical protein [Rickettsiaceae bacterium]
MTKEQDRLLNMLNDRKITKEDYRLLSAAVDKKQLFLDRCFQNIINPFKKIAGLKALLIGIVIIFVMSFLAVIANVYILSPLSILNASAILNSKMQPNVLLLLYQNIISWLGLSGLFILVAFTFKQKGIRLIDFFGTVALAKFPYLILTLTFAILQIVNPGFMHIDITQGLKIEHSMTSTLLISIMSICVIWQIVLYFHAFKESSGMTGAKLWIGFVVSIIISEMMMYPLTTIFM